jgi:hypothetical protein
MQKATEIQNLTPPLTGSLSLFPIFVGKYKSVEGKDKDMEDNLTSKCYPKLNPE